MRKGAPAPANWTPKAPGRTVFGIDLGMSSSSIAYIDETGQPAVVSSAAGESTTPSVVYFADPDRVVVGVEAKSAALLAPHLVVQQIKRRMGDPRAELTFHGVDHTPETISALILKELAEAASHELGTPARDVVITVPAYFGVA